MSRWRLFAPWRGLNPILLLMGNLVVVVSLFLPWIDMFKLSPTGALVVPRQGYSPWMALQRGIVDALGAASGLVFLLTIALVLSSLMAVRLRAADMRRSAAISAAILAFAIPLMGVVATNVVGYELAVNYPHYDSGYAYGQALGVAGCLCVFVGINRAGILRRR
jgi:hypothetical protein